MHELAIAQTLLDTAAAVLAEEQGVEINSLRVRLGPLAGVSKDELAFGFSVVATSTRFAGASLEIDDAPVVVRCASCQATSHLPDVNTLLCPVCGSSSVQVTQGKEIALLSIEVFDGDPEP